MIWKEDDVIDIAKGKKAIQSSISRFSQIDDASRACDSDIEVQDFAFCTDKEDNPWWMLDLEEESEIDCIRITNRISEQEIAKNISVELSLDKNTWIKISPSLFEWQELNILDVNILKSAKARYIKLTLNLNAYFALKKVEVFVRKVKGYVISGRPDGLGMRIGATILALYIAKKTGLKFMLSWPNSTDTDHMGALPNVTGNISYAGEILHDNEVFEEDFLKKHLIQEKTRFYGDDFSLSDLQTKPKELFKRKYGGICGTYPNFKGFDEAQKEQCLKELSQCYKEIKWSCKCLDILNEVEKCFKNLNDNFIALHIRGGDVVYGNFRIAPNVWLGARFFPYEIALEIALKELENGNNILIFGQDFQSNQKLENYLNAYNPNKNLKIFSVDSLLSQNYANAERSFFEINLMSKASKIYATGGSAFSRAASLISGKEILVSFYTLYSAQELYDIMLKNIDILSLSKYQKAFSYYQIFMFSRRLNQALDLSLEFVKRALEFDNENDGFRVAIMDILFQQNQYEEIETMLKICCNERLDTLCDALYGNHTRFGWAKNHYTSIYQKYLDFNLKQDFPYISFIAAKIAMNYYKDYKMALDFIKLSLQKEPSNELFLQTYKALCKILKIDETKQNITQKPSDAKARIHNHLAYKLGQIMIRNSKSFFGFIKMSYLLMAMTLAHKEQEKIYKEKIKANPKLALPPLESYKDYKEALKEKECFTYKLGEAFMKGFKSWYKGGLIKFYFEAKRLERKFKRK
ncbi:MAG: discoidin domain-containing protein [Helicobacter sp.]|nr:discoidin domain-containing protein [Helicobacter sp.]